MTTAPVPRPRRRGMIIVSLILALYGIGSIQVAVALFPVWLASAGAGRYGNVPFLWISIATALCSLAGAYGSWDGRRWTRLPFVICVLSAIGTWVITAWFGLGEAGGGAKAIAAVTVLTIVIVVCAGFAIRYVWRHT